MACRQNINAKYIPALVINALQVKFPDANKVEWEKINNLYEADYEIASAEYSALIDASGKMVMYKQEIPETELPVTLSGALRQNFSGYTLEETERIYKNGEVFYQIELEKNNQELNQVFSENGQASTGLKYWE